MGCTLSVEVQPENPSNRFEGEDDEDEDDMPRRASVVVRTIHDGADGEVPMQLVMDANGDKAVVQVFFENSLFTVVLERIS